MRVLGISHLYPTVRSPQYGIFAARQMEEMVRQGCEITLIVPRVYFPSVLSRFSRWQNLGHKAPLLDSPSLQLISLVFPRPLGAWFNRWAGLVVYWRARNIVKRLHRQQPFDVIYATDLFPDGDAAARLGKSLSIPATCLAIGVDVNHTATSSPGMYRHFVRTVNALDGTLACGRSVADGIEAVRDGETLNVFGVVDLELFSPVTNKSTARAALGLQTDEIIFSYAGYLSERKGVLELVDAFACVVEDIADPVRLVLCGSGDAEPRLRTRIRELKLADRVQLLGKVDPEKVRDWLRASDIFVLPSHTEGMPNAVMEAMACGLPVIATEVGGLPEAVGDCVGATLVPPQQVQPLRAAMSRLARDATLREQMAAASRQHAVEAFGAPKNARRILDYLGQVVARRSAK